MLLIATAGCQPSSDASSTATGTDRSAVRDSVRALLDRQVRAWNQGDIEGFMAGYAQTDTLRFASGGTVRTGWQTTLERYRSAYPDRAAMGRLVFDRLEIEVLAPRWVSVFGAWRLDRAEDAPQGLFTLLVHRTADGWRIVHDHTSSAS
jgi:ketosteroid isomerase-like protein